MSAEVDAYRLSEVERLAAGLEKKKADVDDLNQIASEVRSLRKTLIGLMVTIAGSAVLFALTTLTLLAQHG